MKLTILEIKYKKILAPIADLLNRLLSFNFVGGNWFSLIIIVIYRLFIYILVIFIYYNFLLFITSRLNIGFRIIIVLVGFSMLSPIIHFFDPISNIFGLISNNDDDLSKAYIVNNYTIIQLTRIFIAAFSSAWFV